MDEQLGSVGIQANELAGSLTTAKELHDCFAGALKRRRKPDMHLCAELAKQINQSGPMFNQMLSVLRGDFLTGWRKDVARAVRDGRRFASSLRRLEPVGVNLLAPRPPPGEGVLATVTRWIEQQSRSQFRDTESALWTACAEEFTPHIVDTLRKAGWRDPISTTKAGSPVIAVLSMLIGAVTGAEPPDQDSLGSTLRQAGTGKSRKETRQE